MAERKALPKTLKLASKETADALSRAKAAEEQARKTAEAEARAALKAKRVAERKALTKTLKLASKETADALSRAEAAEERAKKSREQAEAARERAEAAKEQAAAEAAEREQVAAELRELRASYHLSGFRKKLDIREIQPFAEIAATVIGEERTGMNYDRFFILWQAALGAPGGSDMIEIGTYMGGSAKFIAESLRQVGRSPAIYVCDTFTGHPRTDAKLDLAHHEAGKFEDVSLVEVEEYLSPYSNVSIVEGDIVDTSERFRDGSFGFVHVDVDVHPATRFCLEFFAPRLAPGGAIVVDDYGFRTCPGAKQAVDDFVAAQPAFRMFHLLTGQAILFASTPAG